MEALASGKKFLSRLVGRIPNRFGVTALLGLAVLAPVLVQNDYYIQLCTEILIASLLAISLNFLIGFTGLVSLGHAVYLGVGAYAFALLTKNVYPSMWAGLIAAGASCALLAWFMGVFCVRLAGLYFAMLTLAFSQVVYTVAYYWRDVTGGDDGMLGIPKPEIGIPGAFSISLESFTNFYYFVLIIVAALIFLAWKIANSPFGRVLQAIRENPERVEFIGLPVHRYKLFAFIIAGTLGGFAGGLYSTFQGYISPDLLYWTQSGEIVLMTILGGMYSFLGPAFGAGMLLFIRDTVLNFMEYWRIVVGGILVLLVLFLPGGILGFFEGWISRLSIGGNDGDDARS